MLAKAKKVEILNNEAQSQVKIFWQKLLFWAETFIQVSLEFFCKFHEHIQGIWEVHLT